MAADRTHVPFYVFFGNNIFITLLFFEVILDMQDKCTFIKSDGSNTSDVADAPRVMCARD